MRPRQQQPVRRDGIDWMSIAGLVTVLHARQTCLVCFALIISLALIGAFGPGGSLAMRMTPTETADIEHL